MGEQETRRIGDYEILEVLGSGGMGQVFKVRNVISDRIEAMKIILPDLAGRQDLADRFLREIKLLAGLDHPNIAALRTALTVDNQLVMIMEYVEGVTLAARLEKGPIPVREAINYIDQVLSALSYAHQRNIIHRDIKPSNMMLTPECVVKLMDFGIARSASDASLTLTGATLGSLYYMSPEQVKGQPTDARSDLYSVGVSLYEMVTGSRPFQGGSDFSVMAAQIDQPPKPPIEVRADLPAALNEIILLTMAKDPGQRFRSADALRNALKSVAIAPQEAPAAAPSATAETVHSAVTVTTLPGGAVAAKPEERVISVPVQAPLPATQPAPQPIPSVMSASSPRKSHRALYVALGGVLVVAFLIAAGFYFPRREKTRAGEQASNTEQKPSTEASQNPAVGETTAQPAATASPAVSETGGSAAAPAQSPGSNEASISGGSATAEAGSVSSPEKTAKSIDEQVRKASAKAKLRNQGQAPPALMGAPSQSAETTGQPAGETPQPDNSAVLEELEKQIDQLSSRATAVHDSLENLRRQQAAQGLGLRGDIAATEERLKIHVGKAQSALQAQDVKNAKKYADQAETELEQLERFLGR